MTKQTLNITNGSSLTEYLEKEKYEGEMLTWHEMLCEGPTEIEIDTTSFFETRKAFLESVYDAEYDILKIQSEIQKTNNINEYKEVILWFEYDLFCHINLIAAISLLKQKDIRVPMFLVCSGRVKGEKGLKGLPELSPKQLKEHYQNRIELTIDDIATAQKAWSIYCEGDHNLLKPLITRVSNFKYLSICLKAHLKRFPDTRSGLSTLEYNILILIKEHTIKSRHHLVGYVLHYQGYYGFGDMQIVRLINELEIFYTETEDTLTLNRDGHLALEHQKNFRKELNCNFVFGGVNKREFQFDKKTNQLIKNTVDAN
ncbi:DUF1835 domain-containing protein [Lacinutrix sp. Bg11-31]|uniref:DUF1835 domain-containing protein n=1 Tax=Lacinutrix sp. Bg11-31 TaxID=2057808 RepID=UPI000C30EA74|nr:DUF1835 domain-containing protein [Lacinutrix sp. Bg11-31]AUC81500.1 DUF1835 domain-containing protein [Lacinutrix sp. Bg11-31]